MSARDRTTRADIVTPDGPPRITLGNVRIWDDGTVLVDRPVFTTPQLVADAAPRERVLENFDALHEHLERLNGEGIPPDVSGYDSNGQPILVWLAEEGGDSTWPWAATLGGEDSAHPAVGQHHADRLAYPVLILDVSTPRSPAAVHEQEVPGDWEYGFTYIGPNGVAKTEWGFAQEPAVDSDGEIEVHLDEWVTVTSIVRRRFAASETVRDLAARTPGASS